jgi:hypothetical protein
MNENVNRIPANFLTSRPQANPCIARRLGFDKKIKINNISGQYAWVILSPTPIHTLSSIGIAKIGNLSMSRVGGEIKCQQFGITNNNEKEYELDSNRIYYTVFFNCDGNWKCPYRDRIIDAKNYNITLLPKNVDESIDTDFIPE